MLGSGDPGLEHGMREMERCHKGRVVGWVGFSVPVSHKITAGADILAMPSRFEPCGLNQLYALRYGHPSRGARDGRAARYRQRARRVSVRAVRGLAR
jgi:starch synthase